MADGGEPTTDYTAADLQGLDDLEHVRKRPAMYIGDIYTRGYHHLVWEAVDNSVDEAMEGHASHISVTVHADGSVSVADDDDRSPSGEPKAEVFPSA